MARRRVIASIALAALLLVSIVGTSFLKAWVMSDADAQGDSLRQAMVAGVFALAWLGSSDPSGGRPPANVPISLAILLLYCVLTAVWAIEPAISLRRSIQTGMIIWIASRTIGDLGVIRTLRILRIALVIILIANLLAVWLLPGGVHPFDINEDPGLVGDWRGIMPHKNVAGAASALTVLLFLFDLPARARSLVWPVIALGLLFLVGSDSRTSIGALLAAAIVGTLARLYNPRFRSFALAGLALAAIAMAFALVVLIGSASDSISGGWSLTGRSVIWSLLLEYSAVHPWTGAGFGSFWQIGPSSPIWSLTSSWVARYGSHGHNGYLDLLVTIGWPGTILAVAVMIGWPVVLLLLSADIGRSRRALLIAMITFAAVHNITESSLLDRSSLVEVSVVIAVLLTHRLAAQSRGRHRELQAATARALSIRRFRTRLAHATLRRQ